MLMTGVTLPFATALAILIPENSFRMENSSPMAIGKRKLCEEGGGGEGTKGFGTPEEGREGRRQTKEGDRNGPVISSQRSAALCTNLWSLKICSATAQYRA